MRIVEATIIAAGACAADALFTRFAHPAWTGVVAGGVPGAGTLMLAVIAALLSPFLLPCGRVGQAVSPLPGATALMPPLGLLFLVTAVIGAEVMGHPAPPLGFFLLWAALACPVLLLARALYGAHLGALRRHGVLRDRIAIVACDGEPEEALTHVATGQPDIEVVGTFHAQSEGLSNHASIDTLIERARRVPIDRVILVTRQISAQRLENLASRLKTIDVDAVLLCVGSSAVSSPLALDLIRRPLRGWDAVLKSAEDRLIALAVLPLALPLMALIALAIRLDSKGPVLFRQNRHGRNNTEFQIFKFRTMEWRGAALATGARQTSRGDARITRVGGFLRKTSLDELPQLFNVLRGEMSIVGPRPHPVMMRTEDRLGHEITPDYSQRHRVKPGLTGLAQINGSRGALETAEQLHHRLEHDLRYIDTWSLSLDLGILALTPIRLLWHRDKAF